MLAEDVWLSIARIDEFVCFRCMERRLGRRLTAADLADVPGNYAARTLLARIIEAKPDLELPYPDYRFAKVGDD